MRPKEVCPQRSRSSTFPTEVAITLPLSTKGMNAGGVGKLRTPLRTLKLERSHLSGKRRQRTPSAEQRRRTVRPRGCFHMPTEPAASIGLAFGVDGARCAWERQFREVRYNTVIGAHNRPHDWAGQRYSAEGNPSPSAPRDRRRFVLKGRDARKPSPPPVPGRGLFLFFPLLPDRPAAGFEQQPR
jgi:hypothetical protein